MGSKKRGRVLFFKTINGFMTRHKNTKGLVADFF